MGTAGDGVQSAIRRNAGVPRDTPPVGAPHRMGSLPHRRANAINPYLIRRAGSPEAPLRIGCIPSSGFREGSSPSSPCPRPRSKQCRDSGTLRLAAIASIGRLQSQNEAPIAAYRSAPRSISRVGPGLSPRRMRLGNTARAQKGCRVGPAFGELPAMPRAHSRLRRSWRGLLPRLLERGSFYSREARPAMREVKGAFRVQTETIHARGVSFLAISKKIQKVEIRISTHHVFQLKPSTSGGGGGGGERKEPGGPHTYTRAGLSVCVHHRRT